MKNKLLPLLFLVCCSMNLAAQLTQGNFLAGLSGNFNQQSTNNADTTGSVLSKHVSRQYFAQLRVGYFVADHFVLGLQGGLSNGGGQWTQVIPGMSSARSVTKSKGASYGLFARYYKSFSGARFALFGHCEVARSFSEQATDTEVFYELQNMRNQSHSSYKLNSFAATLSPGLTWFVTSHFAIEAQVGQVQYISSEASEFGTDHLLISRQRTTAFGVVFNPQTFLMGVTFYMGENRKD